MDFQKLDAEFKTTGEVTESNETYHGNPGLSNTGLKHLAKTPAHFYWSKLRPKKQTASQKLGSLTHLALEDRAGFEKKVFVVEGNRNANSVKAAIAAAESEGYIPCKQDEKDDAMRMADAVLRNDFIAKILSTSRVEKSIYWRHEETGVLLKCRPDAYRADGVVLDWKTYTNLGIKELERQVYAQKYHWQSRHYLNGVNKLLGLNSTMFVHVFIDTEAFTCRTVVLGDASLDKAESQIEPLIKTYAACLKENTWPGYPEGVSQIELPTYAWSEVEE